MKQSQAVYQATQSVCEEHGIEFAEGMDFKEVFNTDQRAQVIELVTDMLINGQADFSDKAKAKYDTRDKVRGYVSGMVSNWYRKDQRLNGGVQYKPKNPGSRTGSQDEEVKNLKLLIKSGQLDEDGVKIAQARLDERIAEIKASKAQVDINFDALDPELLASLGISE